MACEIWEPILHGSVRRNAIGLLRHFLGVSNTQLATLCAKDKHSASTELSRYWNQETALHLACRLGFFEAAIILILAGSDVNGESRETPLHLAASGGHLDIIELLLYFKAIINSRSFDGATPMWRAVDHGHVKVVQRLIKDGADLELGAHMEDDIKTPLQIACMHGQLKLVQMLMLSGCKVNFVDIHHQPAIFDAVACGNRNVVQLLSKYGADVSLKNSSGEYLLHTAARVGDTKMIKLLVDLGCCLYAGTGSSLGTPLHVAVNLHNKQVVALLCKLGLDPNLENFNGSTPLSSFVQDQANYATYDFSFIIKLLIQNGAGTPFHFSSYKMMIESCLTFHRYETLILLIKADFRITYKQIEQYSEIKDMGYRDKICAEIYNWSSLQRTCRRSLKKTIKGHWPYKEAVNKLPLPQFLKGYLMYNDLGL